MERINGAIIGLGRMGITHLAILNRNPEIQITAICEQSSLVVDLVKKFIPGISLFNDYKKMIKDAGIKFVIICTPPNLHFEMIEFAIENNIHVFVEKPLTLSFQEGIKLISLTDKKNLVNQVGYVNRFNDVFRKTKELLESNVLGKVIKFKSEMYGRTIIQENDSSSWRSNHATGGGCIYEFASHSIDLVVYLFGKPEKVLGSHLQKVFSKSVEDLVTSNFIFSDDSCGSIYVNWSDETYRKPSNKIEIFAEKGKILADQYSLKVYLKKDNPEAHLKTGWNNYYITDITSSVPFYVRGNEFTSQLCHFVDCIINSRKSICTFEEANKTQEIIDSIFSDFNNK